MRPPVRGAGVRMGQDAVAATKYARGGGGGNLSAPPRPCSRAARPFVRAAPVLRASAGQSESSVLRPGLLDWVLIPRTEALVLQAETGTLVSQAALAGSAKPSLYSAHGAP